jgi:hypothetical protein
MLAATMVAEVRRLLDEGEHCQRKIAQLLGISRGTVLAIARRRRDRLPGQGEEGPMVRCAGCGGMITIAPCQLCRARRIRRHNPRAAVQAGADECRDSLAVDLRREHRRRYEEVLAWRQLEPVRLIPSRIESY